MLWLLLLLLLFVIHSNVFYYRYAGVHTFTPWFRPNDLTIRKWFNEISKLNGYSKCKLYIFGSYNSESRERAWDLDIQYVTDEPDHTFMKQLIECGLRHRLLVDVTLYPKKLTYDNLRDINYKYVYGKAGLYSIKVHNGNLKIGRSRTGKLLCKKNGIFYFKKTATAEKVYHTKYFEPILLEEYLAR